MIEERIDRRPQLKDYFAYTAIVLILLIVFMIVAGLGFYFLGVVLGKTAQIVLSVVGGIMLLAGLIFLMFRSGLNMVVKIVSVSVELVRESAGIHADIAQTYTDVVNHDDANDRALIVALKDLVGHDTRYKVQELRNTHEAEKRLTAARQTDERLRYLEGKRELKLLEMQAEESERATLAEEEDQLLPQHPNFEYPEVR